jgi:hypothetical protein
MDLKLVETYNGGDIVKSTKDFVVIYGLGNMVYLALFGGNVEANTPNRRFPNEQNHDFWANELLMNDEPGLQFNSDTERALMTTPLTSAGRSIIQAAVARDLKHMKDFAKVGLSVAIIATDVVRLGVRVQEPDNLEARDFIFIWDATRGELVDDLPARTISFSPPVSSGGGFDYSFDFSFI